MEQKFETGDAGEELWIESMEHVVRNVEAYCAHEERRITLKNQPDILALRAEYARLLKEEERLEDRLERAPRPGERTSRRRRSLYYWTLTGILTIAGFVFSLLSFDPYRLGWKSYLYCFGIAVITPFLIEKIIGLWKARTTIKWCAIVACVAALLSLGLLAVIRGDLFAEQFKEARVPVIVEDETSPAPENTFYEKTVPLLRIVMVLLALAMELGAGLALHDAWRTAGSPEDWDRLERELRDVRGRMTELVYEITKLQNESAIFVSRFWRNFYRAVLTHATRSAMTKLLLVVIATLPFVTAHAATPPQLTIVLAVDLTQSVAIPGPDGHTDFEKNTDGVTRILLEVPSGCRVVILGITDRSFAQPYILLTARTPEDAGYFGERLQHARKELVRIWKSRIHGLTPKFKATDVFGALLLAAQIFNESPSGRKALIIFSDMRHSTPDVDLESLRVVPAFATIERRGTLTHPGLQGVEVYALGVDGAEKAVSYWQSLERFWKEYFNAAGAHLLAYSVLRSLPSLSR